MPKSADKGCHVVSVTDPYGRIVSFVNRLSVSTETKNHATDLYEIEHKLNPE
jgi:phosphopantetheine adenylyltransferase